MNARDRAALRRVILAILTGVALALLMIALASCTIIHIEGNGNTLTDIGGDISVVPRPRDARPMLLQEDGAEPRSARP
jgi:hypothetical protein